jgi:transcriptional regulator with GAF, ATPase, and Fis domain
MNRSSLITTVELPEDTPDNDPAASQPATLRSIADIDKAHIMAVLKQCKGKVSGKGGAAEILKIPATTLASKMKRLGITWHYLLE